MRILTTVLLGVSLAANAVVGFLIVDLRQDFDNTQTILDEKVAAAESRLADLVDTAIEKVPDADLVRQQVDDLETKLFGLGGGSKYRDGIVNILADSSANHAGDIGGLKSCVNSAFRTLGVYATEIARWAGITASGGYAFKPTFRTPSCL